MWLSRDGHVTHWTNLIDGPTKSNVFEYPEEKLTPLLSTKNLVVFRVLYQQHLVGEEGAM